MHDRRDNYNQFDPLTQSVRREGTVHSIVEVIEILRQDYGEIDAGYAGYIERKLQGFEEAFSGLDNLRGKRVLDLGCGSNGRTVESNSPLSKEARMWEPWLCRALLIIGAMPEGVDVGSLEGEKFVYHNVDLCEPKIALSHLAPSSFDAISHSNFLDSPELEHRIGMVGPNKRSGSIERWAKVYEEINNEVVRLLKPGGLLLTSDPMDIDTPTPGLVYNERVNNDWRYYRIARRSEL